jgi:hypothetical protein
MGRKLLLGLLLLAPLGVYPFLRDTKVHIDNPYVPPAANPLSEQAQVALHCFSAIPGPMFPSIPWEPLRRIAADQSDEFDALVQKDPVQFLERCLAQCQRDAQNYRCIFAKRERVNGSLGKRETILVHFREKPFSVHMEWKDGIQLCFGSLYVEGENGGNLLARSCIPGIGMRGPVLSRPLDGADVTSTSRFGIDKFGMICGAKDTLEAAKAAQKAGTLHLRYDGIETVEKAGNRLCYKLVRTPYDPPEAKEGINELTIYIDRATLLQVGSILIDAKGEFVAEYFFRDIEINPKFKEGQFTKKAL